MLSISAPTAKDLFNALKELEEQDVDLSSIKWLGFDDESLYLSVKGKNGNDNQFLRIDNE